MTRCRIGLAALAIALSGACAFAAQPAPAKRPSGLELGQGQLAEFKIAEKDIDQIEARIDNQPVYFYPNESGGFAALVGADVLAKPGIMPLQINITKRDGRQQRLKVPIKIKARQFKQESFNVAPGFDDVSPETLEEIRREQSEFARVFAAPAAERYWEYPFIRPVPQEASASSFGARRIINGTSRAPHAGTDLSAPAGTEVVAVNNGRVVLVGNYFFAGGAVVIDHGAGLFSMYFHLSEFKVEEGAMVRRGDVLALSGATGRVTGPHLHLGFRLNNVRIDPLDLLAKLSISSSGTKEPAAPASETEN
jgi:murein DD-endopeptidase MepM/ murein hydrolase activator NlpD